MNFRRRRTDAPDTHAKLRRIGWLILGCLFAYDLTVLFRFLAHHRG